MASTLFSYFSTALTAITSMLLPSTPPNTEPPKQQPFADNIKTCLSRISDSSSHQTFTLPSNRTLGFATFGSETGHTVFHFHGFGDGRLLGALFHEAGLRQGIRIVAVDRPGIGLSTLQPGRRALDHAEDIRLLAAHLGAKTYSVMGVSGGGSYALACAHALPAEQLKSVSIVCGFGPFDMTMRNSSWTTYLSFNTLRYFPFLLRWMRASQVEEIQREPVDKFIAKTKAQLAAWYFRFIGPHARDAALLQDEDFLALVYAVCRDACRQGLEGHMDEWRVMSMSDLGFDLGEVRADLPVDLWYGTYDASVSCRVGEALDRAVGGDTRLFVREEAHLGLPLNCRGEILEKMVERM